MVRALTVSRIAARAGMIGSAAIAGSAVLAAIAYHGTDGEAYSPLNHYVSELGQLGVSSLAAVFNSGLIVGGVCFAVFMLGLGWTRGGLGGRGYGLIGAIAGVAGALVGIYPLNNVGTHGLVAFAFFNVTWIAIALASVDILVRPDPRLPLLLAVLGLVVVAAFIGFIWAYALFSVGGGRGIAPTPSTRAAIDPVTVFEWLAVAGVATWTFAVAATWVRAADPSAA
jgi:hypothetical membrane protein